MVLIGNNSYICQRKYTSAAKSAGYSQQDLGKTVNNRNSTGTDDAGDTHRYTENLRKLC